MFIRRDEAIKSIDDYAQALYSNNDWKMGETADYCSTLLESVTDAYVVDIDEYRKLNFKCTVMKALLMGEWVKCEDVQEALNLTFDQCMRMFEFGRTASWNPAPLEGQKVTTKFMISEKTLEQTKMKDFEKDFKIQEAFLSSRSNPDTHQWELILEQQGGII